MDTHCSNEQQAFTTALYTELTSAQPTSGAYATVYERPKMVPPQQKQPWNAVPARSIRAVNTTYHHAPAVIGRPGRPQQRPTINTFEDATA